MGSRDRGNQITVASAGVRPPLDRRQVRRIVRTVLEGEGSTGVTVSVTFLSSSRMRALHRKALGSAATTDVVAFPLAHGHAIVGDIYICPERARQNARELGIPVREEMVRLVVHGTLHVLGYDHPPGAQRVRSPMWRRQERYVRRLVP